MRNEKVVTIKVDQKNTRDVTVYEVRPGDVLKKIEDYSGKKEDVSLADAVKDMLPMLTDATTDELAELYPSELEALWEAFKEVNAPFLRMLRAAGLAATLEQIKARAMRELNGFVLASFNTDTGSMTSSGSTG